MKVTSLKNSFLFIILTVFALISLYGRNLPVDKNIFRRIDRFVVRPYKYGLYITQPNSGVFYNISPYDAYIREGNNIEKRLLVHNPEEIFSNEYVLLQKDNSFLSKIYSVLSYFHILNPKSTFPSSNGQIILESNTLNNSLYVSLENDSLNNNPNRDLTLTLSFNNDDIIFNESGYIYNTPQTEEVTDLAKVTNFPLAYFQAESPKRYVSDYKYLYIINKKTPGVIRLDLNEPQYKDVYVNLEKQLIEFEIKPLVDAKVRLNLFDSFSKAKGSL